MPMMHTGTMTSDLQVVSSPAGEEKQYISFPLLEPVRMDWAVSKAEKSSSEKADGCMPHCCVPRLLWRLTKA